MKLIRSRVLHSAALLAIGSCTSQFAQAMAAGSDIVPPFPAAVDGDVAAALNLADTSQPADGTLKAEPHSWRASIEEAVRASAYRHAESSLENQLALDFQLHKTVVPDVNLNLSARYDRFDPLSASAPAAYGETTLREAYAAWNVTPVLGFDLGAVNERVGAAVGYNPTDYFRAGAVNPDLSPDPESRRVNRLGTVAVRAQQVWDSGSAQLMFSPRLTSQREPGSASATSKLQRTNGVNRWLFVGSQKVSASVQPQLLLYGEEHGSPQVGLNLSVSPADPLVAYAEWTGGRRPSLIGRANDVNDTAFRTSYAVGATWTLPTDLSLTAELQGNAAGATPAQWRTSQQTDVRGWANALSTGVASQDLPTRYGGFVMARWRDVGIRRLDLNAFAQFDQGGGQQQWIELRRRYDRFDVALQLQRQSGPSWNRYGAQPETRSVQVVSVFYE
ncbi:hypothetical protein [Paraburkholderia aromaticivorans]|uniref:hypothetical protein n=1 Tax=Paraburkholderia aromaticivorans TaxID=2026199 RepID=UPI001455EA4D|nr:hypothetical protein [Paraburkholderia aromaticivorans]